MVVIFNAYGSLKVSNSTSQLLTYFEGSNGKQNYSLAPCTIWKAATVDYQSNRFHQIRLITGIHLPGKIPFIDNHGGFYRYKMSKIQKLAFSR